MSAIGEDKTLSFTDLKPRAALRLGVPREASATPPAPACKNNPLFGEREGRLLKRARLLTVELASERAPLFRDAEHQKWRLIRVEIAPTISYLQRGLSISPAEASVKERDESSMREGLRPLRAQRP